MRKAAAWFFIFLGSAAMVCSTVGQLMHWLSTKRAHLTGWAGVHRFEEAGDLVSMAYLDKETKFFEAKDYQFIRPADTGQRTIDLYVYGDSYTRDIPDSAFARVNRYQYGRRDYSDLVYTLDPHKKNILLIEDAERFIRPYFRDLAIFNHVRKSPAAPTTDLNANPAGNPLTSLPQPQPTRVAPAATLHKSLFGITTDLFFNPGINHNLEFNLFGYSLLDPIKLFKASATYRLFGRTSGDVVVSDNGQYLFLRQTVEAHDPLSSYEPIDTGELRLLTDHLNTIYHHYRQEGFDEVYLSIIPNSASILQPIHYNGLIPTLQKSPDRQMQILDIYSPFASDPDPGKLYRVGDTHWNNKGMQRWLAVVNQVLKEKSVF